MQSLHKDENLLFEDFHGFLGKTHTFPRMGSPTEKNDSLGASYGHFQKLLLMTSSRRFFVDELTGLWRALTTTTIKK
jgi:hypothetical protein